MEAVLNTYLPIIAAVGVLLLLGYIQLRLRLGEMQQKRARLVAYANKFNKLIASMQQGKFDGDLYTWLVSHSKTVQEDLGYQGIMPLYRKPFTGEIYRNYALI